MTLYLAKVISWKCCLIFINSVFLINYNFSLSLCKETGNLKHCHTHMPKLLSIKSHCISYQITTVIVKNSATNKNNNNNNKNSAGKLYEIHKRKLRQTQWLKHYIRKETRHSHKKTCLIVVWTGHLFEGQWNVQAQTTVWSVYYENFMKRLIGTLAIKDTVVLACCF